MTRPSVPSVDRLIREALERQGLDVAALATYTAETGRTPRVVVIPASLEDSRADLGKALRDRVVMVRVDGETTDLLDRWVEAGLAGSRSEAAALFIREGLAVRAPDLAALSGALNDLERARARLQAEARRVLGTAAGGDEPGATPRSGSKPRRKGRG